MINIELITFKRAIMHEIHRKTNQSDATTTLSNNLVPLESEVTNTLKERLNVAFGKRTRCFEMNISNIGPESFYSCCFDLKYKEDKEFISQSQNLADLLAKSQNQKRIPGGYFLFIEGENKKDKTAVYIAIKADLQEALAKDKLTGAITVLKEVFLSPAQKLYKVGLLIEKNIDKPTLDPNDNFECFLFDEHFNASDNMPATYFFDDFLGFSESKNSKIVTKRFFDQTSDFINTNFHDMDDRIRLLNAVKTSLIDTTMPTFDPTKFGDEYIKDIDTKNLYASTILTDFPTSFQKDTTLLESMFRKANMCFPNKIKISGPSNDFDECVSIITQFDDLKSYELSANEYTILIVKGKPQRNV